MEEGFAILKQTALGLAAIHNSGIVHRDIKPNNIMIDGIGAQVRLWITDFGLARALQGDTTISGRGAVAGTPNYIAPELLQGHPPSQASDLTRSASSCTKYLLAKSPPYRGTILP